MSELFKGTTDRGSFFDRAPDANVEKVEEKKIVAPATGNLKDPNASSPEDSFLQAMEAAKQAGETIETTEEKDPFIAAIDSGEIDLANLDYQFSAKDMTLMGKFDRLKFLRSLRSDGRITSQRYISLKRNISFSFEEAALLESKQVGRPVDPDEIKADPLLLNKYGFVELDADLAESVEELQKAGVDVMAGAPPNIRKEVGRQSGEEAKLNALNELVDSGQILFYKPSKLGMIITVPTPDGTQDLLLDELGFSGKDFLDMISEVPGIAANIAAVSGAVIASPGLATGGVISMVGLSALSGLSYFTGATASDLVNRHFTKNQIYALDQIARDRGYEAAIATGIDFLLMGGVKIGKGVMQKFIGPVAGSGDLAIKNYLKGIAQGKQVIQYNQQGKIIFDSQGNPKLGDIQLTPGLATQSPTIQRIEGVTEKIPGSADILQTQKEIIEKQLIELEQRAKGNIPVVQDTDIGAGRTVKTIVYKADDLTSAEVGENVSNYASQQLRKDEAVIAGERSIFNTQAEESLDNVAGSLSSTGKKVDTKEAGDLVIEGVQNSRKNYLDEYKKLDDAMRTNPNFKGDMQIDTSGINKAARKLEESFPTKEIERTTQEPLGPGLGSRPIKDTELVPILPKQLTGTILDDLKNVSNMSIDQAMKFKSILKESYSGATIPSEADQLITKIIQDIDVKLQQAFQSQGPEVLQAYNSLLTHEASKGGIFTNPLIVKILNGAVEPEKVIVPSILNGDATVIRTIENALGKDSTILLDVKSATFNEMLRKSRSSLGADGTNPQVLFDQIANLPDSVQKFLLGKDFKKVKNLLNVLAAERGMIDINQLAGMQGPLVNRLNKIIALERAAEKNFKNKFIKPFLKNAIDETEMNPADFTKYFLSTANPADITNIMQKFSPELQEQIRKRVIQEILESGRSADPDLILKEFASGQTPPHPTLYKAIFKFGGGDDKLARQKLNAVFGQETLDLLEDVAGIRAGQRVTSDVAASAGGLVSGSIVANLLNLRLGNAASIIRYRIAAKILASPAGRAWLTSSKQLPAIGPKTVGITVASKEIFDLVSEEFENEPEMKKIAISLLEKNNAEYEERAAEDKEFMQMMQQKGGAVDMLGAPTEPMPDPEPEVRPLPDMAPFATNTTTNVNTASRLANPNVFAPAGMVGSPTTNLNTMARGQQLFSGPREITFAAEGGIMNARKPVQRVA